MPRLQQLAGVHAADNAGAKYKDPQQSAFLPLYR